MKLMYDVGFFILFWNYISDSVFAKLHLNNHSHVFEPFDARKGIVFQIFKLGVVQKITVR